MNDEVTKAAKELGKQAAILYQSALNESGSSEVANQVVFQFMKALFRQDSMKFFM